VAHATGKGSVALRAERRNQKPKKNPSLAIGNTKFLAAQAYAVKSRLTIGSIRRNRETGNIGKADPPPSGVTTSRPQAKLTSRQDSMASLNSQGQTVNV